MEMGDATAGYKVLEATGIQEGIPLDDRQQGTMEKGSEDLFHRCIETDGGKQQYPIRGIDSKVFPLADG